MKVLSVSFCVPQDENEAEKVIDINFSRTQKLFIEILRSHYAAAAVGALSATSQKLSSALASRQKAKGEKKLLSKA
jgi:hypothetical protein